MPETLVDVPAGFVLRPIGDDGKRTLFRPEEDYKCFDVHGWGTMAHLITDYRWLWYHTINLKAKVANNEQQVANLELQLQIWKDNTKNAERALNGMTWILDKESGARIESESKSKRELRLWRLGTVVGVVIAGVFAGAFIVEMAN